MSYFEYLREFSGLKERVKKWKKKTTRVGFLTIEGAIPLVKTGNVYAALLPSISQRLKYKTIRKVVEIREDDEKFKDFLWNYWSDKYSYDAGEFKYSVVVNFEGKQYSYPESVISAFLIIKKVEYVKKSELPLNLYCTKCGETMTLIKRVRHPFFTWCAICSSHFVVVKNKDEYKLLLLKKKEEKGK